MEQEKPYEIFTDASFDVKAKIATYAIAIIQDNKIIKGFGKKCKIQLENSTECEIYAIFQAINIVETNLIKNKKIQKFWIRTDCKVAQEFFINDKCKMNVFKENTELYNKIKDTYKRVSNKMNKKDCSFKVRWIPRGLNKIAHKYSYSIFKNFKSREYKNNVISLERKELIKFLYKFNSKQCKVLIYLYLISDESKLILKKQQEISENLGISASSINRIFRKLSNINMLEKTGNGKYHLLI